MTRQTSQPTIEQNAPGGTRRGSIVIPTIFTAVMVGLTLGLGFWQVQRGAEKKALIATLGARLSEAPVALPPPAQWSSLTPERDEFRRVTFLAAFDFSSANVFASGSALRSDIQGTGVWVFQPAQTSGANVVVNRGFVSGASRDRRAALIVPSGPLTLTGYIRFPERSGLLTPAANGGLWFVRDIGEMSRASGWGDIAPFYIDLESPVPAAGEPKPGPLTPKLRDEHLQYAITWFGLAGAISIAFLVWLRGRRRSALTN